MLKLPSQRNLCFCFPFWISLSVDLWSSCHHSSFVMIGRPENPLNIYRKSGPVRSKSFSADLLWNDIALFNRHTCSRKLLESGILNSEVSAKYQSILLPTQHKNSKTLFPSHSSILKTWRIFTICDESRHWYFVNNYIVWEIWASRRMLCL